MSNDWEDGQVSFLKDSDGRYVFAVPIQEGGGTHACMELTAESCLELIDALQSVHDAILKEGN